MDMDDKQLLHIQIKSLRQHHAMERMKVSESTKKLIDWILDQEPDDALINPKDKKENPWIETRKCTIL